MQEARHADDIDAVALGHTPLNFFGSPTRVVDAGIESAVCNVTGFKKSFEFAGGGGPNSTTVVPTHRKAGTSFSMRSHGGQSCTNKDAYSETRKHGRLLMGVFWKLTADRKIANNHWSVNQLPHDNFSKMQW
jgi:hypothetical protein